MLLIFFPFLHLTIVSWKVFCFPAQLNVAMCWCYTLNLLLYVTLRVTTKKKIFEKGASKLRRKQNVFPRRHRKEKIVASNRNWFLNSIVKTAESGQNIKRNLSKTPFLSVWKRLRFSTFLLELRLKFLFSDIILHRFPRSQLSRPFHEKRKILIFHRQMTIFSLCLSSSMYTKFFFLFFLLTTIQVSGSWLE